MQIQTPLALGHLSEFCTARRVVGGIIVLPFFKRFPGHAGTLWKVQVLTPKQRILSKCVVQNLFQPTPSRERDLPERVSVESVTFHLRDTRRNRYAFKLSLIEAPLLEAFQVLQKHGSAQPLAIHNASRSIRCSVADRHDSSSPLFLDTRCSICPRSSRTLHV